MTTHSRSTWRELAWKPASLTYSRPSIGISDDTDRSHEVYQTNTHAMAVPSASYSTTSAHSTITSSSHFIHCTKYQCIDRSLPPYVKASASDVTANISQSASQQSASHLFVHTDGPTAGHPQTDTHIQTHEPDQTLSIQCQHAWRRQPHYTSASSATDVKTAYEAPEIRIEPHAQKRGSDKTDQAACMSSMMHSPALTAYNGVQLPQRPFRALP